MANVQHKDIVDPNIHEPKGIGLASAGMAYVANGLGSGSWKTILVPEDIGITPSTLFTFDYNRTASLANNVLFPIPSWTVNTSWGDAKVISTNGLLEVSSPGIYAVSYEFTVEVGNNGVYTIATPTKTRSSLTAFHPKKNPSVRGDDGGANGFISIDGLIVRLEAAQGFGLWVTGKRGYSTDGIDDTRIYGWVQMTRLSNG